MPVMVGEVKGTLLPVKATFRLRMWVVGVQQIIHPCCKQGKFLVQVF